MLDKLFTERGAALTLIPLAATCLVHTLINTAVHTCCGGAGGRVDWAAVERGAGRGRPVDPGQTAPARLQTAAPPKYGGLPSGATPGRVTCSSSIGTTCHNNATAAR